MSHDVNPLWHGCSADVPPTVAVCPECHGSLFARSMAWDADTGQPMDYGIEVRCLDMHEIGHRYLQSDWQPARDAIAKWCGATI